MAQSVTQKHLEALALRLNQLTGNDPVAWKREGNHNVASVGNYHVSGQYGGVSLEQMMNESGGVRTVFGTTTKRELAELMRAYMAGMQDVREVKRNPLPALAGLLKSHAASVGGAMLKKNPAKRIPGVRIVYNKLLGGWFIVRGPHQTPIGGRFDSKADAEAHLMRKNPRKTITAKYVLFAKKGQRGKWQRHGNYATESVAKEDARLLASKGYTVRCERI